MTSQMPESALDRAYALQRVGGDEELLKEIAAIFLEDYPNSLAEIRIAIANSDARRLETSAHTLKGSAANFGARAAVDSALRLEQMGRARLLERSADALRDLEDGLEQLHADLQALL